MFKIEPQKDGTINITLTRGDTLISNVVAKNKQTKQTYTPTAEDSIRFAMKHFSMDAKKTRFIDDNPLLTKTIPYDTMLLRVEAADTKSFDFGQYWYDIEITYEDGTVDTFIEGTLTLKKEAD